MSVEINDYFKEYFLTAGNTYDNFLFTDCPKEFLDFASSSLENDSGDTVSCVVKINREDCENFEKLFENSSEMGIFVKTLIARDFIDCKVADVLYKKFNFDDVEKVDAVNRQIHAFGGGELEAVKNLHARVPSIMELSKLKNTNGKYEINFFLEDVDAIYLQRAINNYISHRLPFSVKIFTNKPYLCAYLDEGGNRIECPHDYMTRNVFDFIDIKEESPSM